MIRDIQKEEYKSILEIYNNIFNVNVDFNEQFKKVKVYLNSMNKLLLLLYQF